MHGLSDMKECFFEKCKLEFRRTEIWLNREIFE